MKKALILLLLCGCTHTVTVIKPQEVDIPVPIACTPDIPPEPLWMSKVVIKGTHADKAKAMAHDLDSAHAYIGVLKAGLAACQ